MADDKEYRLDGINEDENRLSENDIPKGNKLTIILIIIIVILLLAIIAGILVYFLILKKK